MRWIPSNDVIWRLDLLTLYSSHLHNNASSICPCSGTSNGCVIGDIGGCKSILRFGIAIDIREMYILFIIGIHTYMYIHTYM